MKKRKEVREGGRRGQGAMEVLRPGAPRVKGDLFILA